MTTEQDTLAWFCVYTKAQREPYAEEHLRRQGFDVYFPRLRVKRLSRGKVEPVIRPMFPGYLFARFRYDEAFRPVTYTRGVRRVVSFGDQPTPVDDRIISEIRGHEDEYGVVHIQPRAIRPGAPVLITEGPFRGLDAVFEMELPDHERVVILLSEIALRARMEVDRNWIRPL